MYEYGLGVSQDLTSAKSMYDRSSMFSLFFRHSLNSQSIQEIHQLCWVPDEIEALCILTLLFITIQAKCAYETYKVTGFSGLFDFINKLNIYKHEDIVLKNNCEILYDFSSPIQSLVILIRRFMTLCRLYE